MNLPRTYDEHDHESIFLNRHVEATEDARHISGLLVSSPRISEAASDSVVSILPAFSGSTDEGRSRENIAFFKRTRRSIGRKPLKGNNSFGRKGTLRCELCRQRRTKVYHLIRRLMPVFFQLPRSALRYLSFPWDQMRGKTGVKSLEVVKGIVK